MSAALGDVSKASVQMRPSSVAQQARSAMVQMIVAPNAASLGNALLQTVRTMEPHALARSSAAAVLATTGCVAHRTAHATVQAAQRAPNVALSDVNQTCALEQDAIRMA